MHVSATSSISSIGRSLLKACAQGSLARVKTYAPQLYITAGIDRTAVPPVKLALATAAKHGHPDILRYFFTNIPQCRQSAYGPWAPTEDTPYNHIPQEWSEAKVPDLVVLRAVLGAQPAVFQTLLDFGFNVNHLIDKLGSALTIAVARRQVEMVRFLLSKGADPNDTYWIPAESVLSRAASFPSLDILNLLLEHGADVQSSAGLYGAAKGGRVDAATVLLDRGADIDEVFRWSLMDEDDPLSLIGTALQVAVEHDKADFVRFLLQQGARTDLEGAGGKSPRQLALETGNEEIIKLLDQTEG